jgi:hypothetical protein
MTQPPSPDFCACCESATSPAPALIDNRPGLAQIRWRTGSYATFRQAMIEAMAAGPRDPFDPDDPKWPGEVRAALSALATRDDADYGMMLVDLFAAVSDVLAFYSERYANEMFLRTARERDSLLRLVRLIGYRLSPGVAATTAVSFTLDAGAALHLAAGVKVMSVPGQDERPQTFETIAALRADARLNDLAVFGTPQPVAPFAQGSRRFPILVRPEALLRGDTVAIIGGGQLELNEVHRVETMPDGEYLELTKFIGVTGSNAVGFKVRRALNLFGHNVPASYSLYDPVPAPALRWKVAKIGTDYSKSVSASQSRYSLDRKVDDLKQGAVVLIDCGPGSPTRFAFGFVDAIETDTDTLGPMTDTVTRIGIQPVSVLVGAEGFALLIGQGFPFIPDIRKTRLFELETRAIVPRRYVYPAALSGQTLHVRRDHLDDPTLIEKKRRIVLSREGRRHLAQITSVIELPADGDGVKHLAIGFTPGLGTPMAVARMNANIAPASHGETQPDETLGHGDASKVFQRFRLQRSPVTRLPGKTGIEPATELAIRVNGELWAEAPSLYGHGPSERIYTVRDGDDGVTTICFGDGKTGARLPSGASNIVARSRTGLGSGGRLKADQLSTVLTRPPGLRAATNPLPTDGGIDPETLDNARDVAPSTVRTFGRAIALQDFEDVARQTGLVSRARASWAWIGLERAIQLTVAGVDGARLSPDAMVSLVAALRTVRDPNHPLIIGNLWRVPIVLTARVLRDPAFEAEMIETNARAALAEFFAFEAQPLARALHLSQIAAVLQDARGVAAVDIDRFRIKGIETWTPAQIARRGATVALVQQHIRIFDARPRVPAAQLDPLSLAGLALDPGALALPAEQAFVALPNTDIVLNVVEAL